MRRRLSVVLATVMTVVILAFSGVALAQTTDPGNNGNDGLDEAQGELGPKVENRASRTAEEKG